MFELNGKTAIVTGGGSGIGAATARRLRQAGAEVLIADIADVASTLDQAALTDVLSYHVFPARVPSDAVPAMADSALINAGGYGVTALFDTSDGVTINGYSTVVIADIKTTNGIVHVVDSVLLPPTLVDHAVAAGLTSLLDTVAAANGDVAGTLSGPSSKTVFPRTCDGISSNCRMSATPPSHTAPPSGLPDSLACQFCRNRSSATVSPPREPVCNANWRTQASPPPPEQPHSGIDQKKTPTKEQRQIARRQARQSRPRRSVR